MYTFRRKKNRYIALKQQKVDGLKVPRVGEGTPGHLNVALGKEVPVIVRIRCVDLRNGRIMACIY